MVTLWSPPSREAAAELGAFGAVAGDHDLNLGFRHSSNSAASIRVPTPWLIPTVPA